MLQRIRLIFLVIIVGVGGLIGGIIIFPFFNFERNFKIIPIPLDQDNSYSKKAKELEEWWNKIVSIPSLSSYGRRKVLISQGVMGLKYFREWWKRIGGRSDEDPFVGDKIDPDFADLRLQLSHNPINDRKDSEGNLPSPTVDLHLNKYIKLNGKGGINSEPYYIWKKFSASDKFIWESWYEESRKWNRDMAILYENIIAMYQKKIDKRIVKKYLIWPIDPPLYLQRKQGKDRRVFYSMQRTIPSFIVKKNQWLFF